ncbi:FkbM family methyltransferase [Candidatus Microgenomates bacterium]|nr:MAG: FkbM family methyltransferase [Candidatus Microgenomates bacterium]
MKYKLFLWGSTILYRLLDKGACTRLAHSKIGFFINGFVFGKKDKIILFETKEGIKVKLPLSDAFTLGLAHLGTIGEDETFLIKKILKKGDTVMDVGAYIDGWYSLMASKLIGSKGKVYTFEPHPDHYNLLEDNVKLNNFTNIEVIKLGVSDKAGIFGFTSAGIGSSLVGKSLKKNLKKKIIKIKTTTIDKFIQEKKIKNISLIKIDVEGAEMKVLKGAKQLLQQKNSPDLILEVVDGFLKNAGSSKSELLSYLNKIGYKQYEFIHNGLKPYVYNPKPKKKEPITNIYFSKNDSRLSPFIRE